MARINRISITLCALLYHPAFNAYGPCFKASQGEFCYYSYHQKADKKKSTATTKKTQKASQKTAKKPPVKVRSKAKPLLPLKIFHYRF